MTRPSREAFEAQDRARYDIDAALYSHDHMGRYRDRPIQCRWETWQAAIQHARDVAARVCNGEMVEEIQPVDHCYNNACVRCSDAIKEALK